MITADQVKKYYNHFSETSLKNDFYSFSPRQDKIKKLCKKFIPDGSKILEIGSGVGITTKYIQKSADSVVSIDISESNVNVARLYANSPNTKFEVVNIIDEPDKIKKYGTFDAVLLFDVIEHIPKESYKILFSLIESVLNSSGIVLITYPSPEYQDYLRENDKKALQIIDQNVAFTDIADSTKLLPYYFNYKTIWTDNQYIHFVLKAGFKYKPHRSKSIFEYFDYRVKKYYWRLSHFFILKKVNSYFTKLK